MKIISLFLAGGLGTLARFGLYGLAHRLAGGTFLWATLTVNVIGCFLFGLAWSLFEGRFAEAEQLRLLVLVGFLGAFTTYSTFAYESGLMLEENKWFFAAANILAHNALGIIAFFAGVKAAKFV